MTFRELCAKEVVQLQEGACLGKVDDMVIDLEHAQIESLLMLGRPRLFGLLGKQADLVIPWQSIQTIGEDTILVSVDSLPAQAAPRRSFSWKKWRDFWGA